MLTRQPFLANAIKNGKDENEKAKAFFQEFENNQYDVDTLKNQAADTFFGQEFSPCERQALIYLADIVDFRCLADWKDVVEKILQIKSNLVSTCR